MVKSRGRRLEKKEKAEAEANAEFVANNDFIELPDADEMVDDQKQQTTFYGLLDRSELEYFKSAESTLSANALTSEEREPFINNVFEEIKGKELKLATHQICSKLIERLVILADEQQLVGMLKAFSGHFFRLSVSKYSSHCLETLLVRCASIIDENPAHEVEVNGETASTENLMLYGLNELTPHVENMIQEKYASHVLRLVLVLVNGLPLGPDLALRSKKSGNARKHTSMDTITAQVRVVPTAFQTYSNEIIAALVKGQDSISLRRMALDTLGSPLLQVVIRAQANKSSFAVVDTIINPENDDSRVFVEHCFTDATGSHFLEAVVGALPKKKLNVYYTNFFKGQVPKLANREFGNYVVQALIKSKLGAKNELIGELLPHAAELVKGNKSQVVGLMIEHATPDVRGKVLDSVLQDANPEDIFESKNVSDALFIERLLQYSPNLCNTLLKKLVAAEDVQKLLQMCVDPVQSHTIEALLSPAADQIERRKILNLFVPITVDLACNAYGSHIVDKLDRFCFKLKFVRERIADALVKDEEKVKHSIYGKSVWKNWVLDKYVHKRFEWWKLIKDQEDEIAATIPQPEKTRSSGKFKQQKRPKTPYDRPTMKRD